MVYRVGIIASTRNLSAFHGIKDAIVPRGSRSAGRRFSAANEIDATALLLLDDGPQPA